jgi:hypothetical protein
VKVFDLMMTVPTGSSIATSELKALMALLLQKSSTYGVRYILLAMIAHILIVLEDDIKQTFPFFPMMHEMFGTRANIIPPMITSGIGPAGRVTVHTQPSRFTASVLKQAGSRSQPLAHQGSTHIFEDIPLDPALCDMDISKEAQASVTAPASPHAHLSPLLSFPELSTPTPTPLPFQRSSALNVPPPAPKKLTKTEENQALILEAVGRAKAQVKLIPAKRSVDNRLADMQEFVFLFVYLEPCS